MNGDDFDEVINVIDRFADNPFVDALSRSKRAELYRRWRRLSRFSFLLATERRQINNRIRPHTFAISVVLPLTPSGWERLWERRIANREIGSEDIDTIAPAEASGTRAMLPHALLIDWWGTDPPGGMGLHRYKRYATCVLPLHIGVFWDGVAPMRFMAEPINAVTERMCFRLGFERSTFTGRLRPMFLPGFRPHAKNGFIGAGGIATACCGTSLVADRRISLVTRPGQFRWPSIPGRIWRLNTRGSCGVAMSPCSIAQLGSKRHRHQNCRLDLSVLCAHSNFWANFGRY